MSPDEMSERLEDWLHHCSDAKSVKDCPACMGLRRVVCVEDDGPRRTWALFEGGRQVGHVRMRATPVAYRVGVSSALAWVPDRTEIRSVDKWTWEASQRTCEALGLDDLPQPRQTDPHG